MIMKKIFKTWLIAGTAFILLSNANAQQQKLAQTGMKFLSVSLDARASALGESFTSLESGASAMFYNPAGMSRITNYTSVSLGLTNYIADIKYMYGAVAFAPFNGEYGVLGINFESVDYGQLQATIRYDNDQGYLDAGTFSPTAMAVGVGYAKAISEKFSVGGNIKYVRQSLGTGIIGDAVTVGSNGTPSGITADAKKDVMAFDFGVLYKTGFKSLDFGMDVRNFSREVTYIRDGFQLPLTFKIGISFNAFDLLNTDKNMHSLLLTLDASHPRDYGEQVGIGAEYTFMNLVSLRVGYQSPNDEKGISAGLGLKHSFSGFDFSFDYAYTTFGIFNQVNQFSIHFAY